MKTPAPTARRAANERAACLLPLAVLAVARTLVDNEATDAVAASVSHSAFETRAFPERERAAAVRKALRVDGAAPHRGDVVGDDHTRLGVKSTRPSCESAFAPNTMLVTATPVLLAVAVVLATIILRASVRPGGAPPLLILALAVSYALSGVAIRALAIPLAPAAPKSPTALKIGLIGAAKIAPWGLLYPARASSNVTVRRGRRATRPGAQRRRWRRAGQIPRHGD